MIVLAWLGGVIVLALAVAVFYDLRARRRGLRAGLSGRDVAIREGTSDHLGPGSVGGI